MDRGPPVGYEYLRDDSPCHIRRAHSSCRDPALRIAIHLSASTVRARGFGKYQSHAKNKFRIAPIQKHAPMRCCTHVRMRVAGNWSKNVGGRFLRREVEGDKWEVN